MGSNESLILNSDGKLTAGTITYSTLSLTKAAPIAWCGTITPSVPVVEYHPLTCTKCGGQVEIKDGFGQCPYCKTSFSATIVIQEN